MDFSFLKDGPVLKGLDNAAVELLVPLFKKREIESGKTVFIENMPGESLYVVEKGEVAISKMLSEGDEQILATVGSGNAFGELALMDGGPRAATARVNSDATLWRIDKSDFDTLCQEHPAVALQFIRNVVALFCHRVRENNQDYREMIMLGIGRVEP